ncbi:hypothetical protein E8E91_15815 [Pseudomonas sp. BN515]|nr:hypothetical protein [Pseudomonas sp. BN515]
MRGRSRRRDFPVGANSFAKQAAGLPDGTAGAAARPLVNEFAPTSSAMNPDKAAFWRLCHVWATAMHSGHGSDDEFSIVASPGAPQDDRAGHFAAVAPYKNNRSPQWASMI